MASNPQMGEPQSMLPEPRKDKCEGCTRDCDECKKEKGTK